MSEWYTNPNVFIRSLASKAALGGLHPKIIEISELMKAAWFDYVIIETVGVGQSEIDIAGLADMTTVVMVPESGDIIQTMKAGVMEIADVFLINKSDRPDAEIFYHHVLQMLRPRHGDSNGIVPVIKTVGTERKGIVEWYDFIRKFDTSINNPLKETMALQKVLSLISAQQLKKIDREKLRSEIENGLKNKDLNIYSLAEKFA
jgi:LAO/AO transport system kinase